MTIGKQLYLIDLFNSLKFPFASSRFVTIEESATLTYIVYLIRY